MRLFGYIFFCLLIVESQQEDEDCYDFNRLAYRRSGNITITGIFDEYTGENCTVIVETGLEQMAAAVWTVTALERYNYLPGVKIGLSLFDACSTSKMAHEAFAEAVIQESCQNVSNIGILTTPEIDMKLAVLSQKLNKTVTRLEPMLNLDSLLTIVAELLTNLHWTTVNRVIADTHEVLYKFSLTMSEEGICVYDEVLSNNTYAVNNAVLKPSDDSYENIASKDTPVIVVLSSSEHISIIFDEMTPEMKKISAKWLLIPTDFVLNIPEENLPEKIFSVLPLIDKTDRLLQYIADEEMQKDHMNHRESTRSPLFVTTAAAILELLKPFKVIQEKYCKSNSAPCEELLQSIVDVNKRGETLQGLTSLSNTPERILNVLKALKIDSNENEPFLYIASLMKKEGKTEDAAIFQVFDAKNKIIRPVPLIVNERLFNERRSRTKRTKIFKLSVDDLEKIKKKDEVRYEVTDEEYSDDFAPFDKHPCMDILTQDDNNLTRSCGICQNFIKFLVRSTRSSLDDDVSAEEISDVFWSWRYRTWVAINASVASIGIICTAAVVIFITVRICKGDILEGNPYFSYLILLSITMLYLATLPFSIDEPEGSMIICRLRIIAPTTSYSILFSIILSRSAMLIFSEREGGIMNHVNGGLQNLLCFFIFLVQFALSVQFWIFNGDLNCVVIHNDHKYVILFVYSFFLLLLLAIAAPLTIRSKRNYREGTFFSIATVLVLIVWAVWVSFYYILPVKERDAPIALGLTATATAVLLSVFIPRTYLMATATVRDKITNALPNLAYINASNISQVNFRSSHALCDPGKCNSPKLSFSNSKLYSVHISNSAPASPNNMAIDGAGYVLNKRRSIEISRTGSPDNSFCSQDSPDAMGKITRF